MINSPTQEETIKLINEAQQGDNNAKEVLLKYNYPLIKSVIKRFLNKGVDYDDLYQLGCVGFLKAIKNFDASFNVKFSTYCVPMIMGEVKRFLRDDGIVKVSRSLKTLNVKLNKYIVEYKNEHNQTSPTIEEMEKEFNQDRQEIILALECNSKPISLSEEYDDDSGLCVGDRIEAQSANYDNEIYIMLKEELKNLSKRDKKIILLRYYRNKTQSEIAKILGVSQVQVSRLEAKIISELKTKFMKN